LKVLANFPSEPGSWLVLPCIALGSQSRYGALDLS
jgi:hypothetical protein